MTTYVADTFTRADSDLDNSTPETNQGGNWLKQTAQDGNWAVASNKAVMSGLGATGEAKIAAESSVADCSISVDVAWLTTTNGGIAFRVADVANWNLLATYSAAGGTLEFYTVVAGAYTQVGSSITGLFTNGVTYNLKVTLSGTSWTAYVDGVSKITTAQSNQQTATKHGMRAVETTTLFDNFLVTDNVAVGAAPQSFNVSTAVRRASLR